MKVMPATQLVTDGTLDMSSSGGTPITLIANPPKQVIQPPVLYVTSDTVTSSTDVLVSSPALNLPDIATLPCNKVQSQIDYYNNMLLTARLPATVLQEIRVWIGTAKQKIITCAQPHVLLTPTQTVIPVTPATSNVPAPAGSVMTDNATTVDVLPLANSTIPSETVPRETLTVPASALTPIIPVKGSLSKNLKPVIIVLGLVAAGLIIYKISKD